ncbi:hypothetical protein B7463_g1049, partial [Scytalidium lignicola]
MTYLSRQGEPDAFTATVVMTSAATIFAIPVNGYNFAIQDTTTSQSSAATVSSQSTPTASTSSGVDSQSTSSKTSSSSTPLGDTVGISIGVVLAVLLIAVVAFLMWRRRKQARSRALGTALYPKNMYTADESTLEHGVAMRHLSSPKELPTTQISRVYEL